MTERVVVIGAGYAGCTVIKELEKIDDIDLTWLSDENYHFVLHESHRLIRKPWGEKHLCIPIDNIKSDSTKFIQDKATSVDTEQRKIEIQNGSPLNYDYLVVCVGSEPEFFGIEGVPDHSYTLNSLEDALEINKAVNELQGKDSKIVIGGGGLTGVQIAGELTEIRDTPHDFDIYLIEAMEEILPNLSTSVSDKVSRKLEKRNVEIITDSPVTSMDEETVYHANGEVVYDEMIWSSGIRGRELVSSVDLESKSDRLNTDMDLRTPDNRVFAFGDSAIIRQNSEVAPTTAQAAWQAGPVVAQNIEAMINDDDLADWKYKDKGTVISIGDDAVAHNVMGLPVDTFNGVPAEILKKMIAVRWIAKITGWGRAFKAWRVL